LYLLDFRVEWFDEIKFAFCLLESSPAYSSKQKADITPISESFQDVFQKYQTTTYRYSNIIGISIRISSPRRKRRDRNRFVKMPIL